MKRLHPGRLLALAAALLPLIATLPAAAQTTAAMPAQRNTRHALIIGIGDYSAPGIQPLLGVTHDIDSARRMAIAMAVPPAQITVLRDHEATAERIRAEITALQARVADGDRVFVYYSGHGTRSYDAGTQAEGCTEALMAADGKTLTNVEMGRRLAPMARKADKMLVFYDACFSGGVAGAPFRNDFADQRSLPGDRITPKFTGAGAPELCGKPSNFQTRSLPGSLQQNRALAQNVVHIAASRPDEVSFDNSQRGGYATTAWRDCLLGDAQDLDGSGAVTVNEVTSCAQAKVSRALAGQPGITGQQLVVAGNSSFVPAWMGAAFLAAPAPVPVATAPAALPAPPVAVVNPAALLAELHGQRDGSRRVEATLRQQRLKIGSDALQIDITPARDGHLYIALAGSDGRSLTLLYPNDVAADNRVRAGQRVSLPGARWEIVSGGPPGTETLLVLVTDAPRDLRGLGQDKAGPFLRTLLDPQGRSRLQAILANGTPAAGCGRPGAASCSDAFGAALLRVEAVP